MGFWLQKILLMVALCEHRWPQTAEAVFSGVNSNEREKVGL